MIKPIGFNSQISYPVLESVSSKERKNRRREEEKKRKIMNRTTTAQICPQKMKI